MTVMFGHHTLWTAGRDAWLSYLAGTITGGLTVAALMAGLGARFPGCTITEAAQRALGRAAGGLFGLAYALYFLLAGILMLRMVTIGIGLVMPRTPLFALTVLLGLPVCYASIAGLQVTARLAVMIFISVFSLGMFVLTLLAVPVSDPALLFPLFEHGYKPFLTGAFHAFGFMGELAILGTLQGRLAGGAAFRYNALVVLIIAGLVGHVIGPIAIFGPEMLGEDEGGLIMPIPSQMKVLSIPDFLERLDSYGMFLYMLMLFLKDPVFLYAAAVEAAHAFGLESCRPLTLPAGAALILSPVIFLSYPPSKAEEFLTRFYSPLGIIMGIGLPALLLAVAALRGFRQGRSPGGSARGANASYPRGAASPRRPRGHATASRRRASLP